MVTGGAVAFTDDGSPVASAEMMRRALEYSTMFDTAILKPLRRLELTRGGVMHEGLVSFALACAACRPWPRNCTSPRHRAGQAHRRTRAHPARVNGRQRRTHSRAKNDGVRVTGEACPSFPAQRRIVAHVRF